MNKLVAIESPINAVANLVASIKSTLPSTDSLISACTDCCGNCQSGCCAKVPIGVWSMLTTARVRPGRILEIASNAPVVKISQPNTKSASPVAIRCARSLPGCEVMRMCEVTEPFFCDIPVMSNTDTPLLSKCAAIPIKAPIVMTPVPPIPFNKML